MREYLENPICKLKPLFKIDYRKKQNIVSACFFKIYGGGYKNFSKYTNGIVILSKYIDKNMKDFRLRLFIDRSIYDDNDIMKILNKLNIDLVLYECTDFKLKKIYHKGLFGTLVRFFPLFDFPNNDANIVINSDIDYTNDLFFAGNNYIFYKNNEKILKKSEVYILYKSNFYITRKKKNFENIYNGYLFTYVLAGVLMGFNKMDNKLIVNFLKNVENSNKKLTFYSDKKLNQKTNFIFGVDEYFTSVILKKYIIREKKPYIQNLRYIITGFLYYSIIEKKNKYSDYTNFFKFVLKDFKNYQKKSTKQNFMFIDKLVYYEDEEIKFLQKDFREITREQELIFFRVYQYFIKIYNTEKIKYYQKDFLDIILQDIFIGLPSINFDLLTDFKNNKLYFRTGIKLEDEKIQFLIDMKKQYKIRLPKLNLPNNFENI